MGTEQGGETGKGKVGGEKRMEEGGQRASASEIEEDDDASSEPACDAPEPYEPLQPELRSRFPCVGAVPVRDVEVPERDAYLC